MIIFKRSVKYFRKYRSFYENVNYTKKPE